MAAVATCPGCQASVAARGRQGVCPSCGMALRFVEVPDRPCPRCGARVPLMPAQEVARCTSCGRGMAADGAPAIGVATCPRCGRRLEVGLDDDDGTCPWCHEQFRLADRLS